MGMTLSEYDRALLEAKGKCAACGEKTEQLNQDHCHATGKARELLCHSCNIILGHVQDNPQKLYKLIKYLEKHALVQCG